MATLYTQVSRNKARSLLYVALFIGLVMALGWFAQWYFDDPFLFIIAFVFAFGMSFSSYWWSDKVALVASRA